MQNTNNIRQSKVTNTMKQYLLNFSTITYKFLIKKCQDNFIAPETDIAFKSLKTGKPRDPKGYVNELSLNAGKGLITSISTLFYIILLQEQMP